LTILFDGAGRGTANAYEKPEENARYGRHGESGFSLIEMMMVAAIGIIATAITFLSMGR